MIAPPPEPPVGVVAMLFTDIEGSTALAAQLGAGWPDLLADHHRILSDAIAAEGGHVEGTEGDAFFAVFADPAAAARAAVAAQRGLRRHTWPHALPELRVRMGLHVGFVERGPTGYVGLEIHRAARVGAAAHGGQLLLTAAAREVVGESVAAEFLGAHRLKDFPAPVHLYCANIDGRGAAMFPPPRTLDARPTNLPAGLPLLIGREEELERIRAALLDERERLVSLTGRGGSGKTSLALVAAAGLLDGHPGGVWWIDLTGLTEPSRVLDAIATRVGAEREVGVDALEAVARRLAGAGPTLVVADNMEHLLPAGADLERLLDTLPNLRLLITTQVPLRLAAERVVALDALDESAALALMERVVARRGSRWPAAPGDRAAMTEIVRLLDGLPLALELAAARLAVLSPAQLCDRLRSSLDLLKDGARPRRQQSLRATTDWTLGLLGEPAQVLFARLAVFAAPVELDEIEAVTGDGLDALEALSLLLDAALVRRVESGDGRIRFGLPEALRQLAAERLDAGADGETWRRRHAERQLELLSVGLLPRNEELRAVLAADAEAAAAIGWAWRQRDGLAARLSVRRALLLANLGRLREASALLKPLNDLPPLDASTEARRVLAEAFVSTLTNQHSAALQAADRAVELARGNDAAFEALTGRGLVHAFAGNPEASLRDHHQATAMSREGDPARLAWALVMETQALIAVGAAEEAAEMLAEARRVGEPADASALRYLDTEEGDLAMLTGRPEAALEPYARSLERAQAWDDGLQVLFDLRGTANALAALGRDEEAAEVLGLAEMQAVDVGGGPTDVAAHLQGDEPVRLALERLIPEQAELALARGRAVSAARRVARACELARAAVTA